MQINSKFNPGDTVKVPNNRVGIIYGLSIDVQYDGPDIRTSISYYVSSESVNDYFKENELKLIIHEVIA
jgi:hypothetical protein